MRKHMQGLGINSVEPAFTPKDRTVAGGSKAGVQQAYEMSFGVGLGGKIYNPPAVRSYDAATDDPIGEKPDMVENLYAPAPPQNQGKGMPSGADWFKKFWYGV